MITGKDLINLGYKPNKWFKEVIEHANRHGLSGADLKTYVESSGRFIASFGADG